MTNRHYNLTADSAGGGCIQGFTGVELVIDEPSLFALDILDAPRLETITIKNLASGKPPHLVLGNLTALRQVKLPGSHPGAVIHLHSHRAPAPLEITGPVGEIDAAWPGVQLRNENRSQAHPWQTVRLGQLAGSENRLRSEALHIVFGQLPRHENEITLGQNCDWHLVGLEGVRHLTINTGGNVTLQQLASLETISSSNKDVKLEIIDACNLREVAGHGHNLSLRQSKSHAAALTIADDWAHVRIASDRLRSLTCKGGKSLELHHCRALKTINLPQGMEVECHGALPAPLANRARFFFNESTLTESLKTYREGDKSQLPTLLHVLSHASESHQAVQALIKLGELCDLGLAPETIWNTRRELSARHLSRPRKNVVVDGAPSDRAFKKSDKSWTWHFPDDLAPQGWQADLDIWAYCHKTVAKADEYSGVMAHSCSDPVALEVLIRRADNDTPVSPLRKLLVQTMREYLRKADDFLLDRQRASNNDLAIRLGRLLQAPDMNRDDQQTLVRFLLEALPLERTLKSVPKVMHLAPGLFRSELMAAARKPDQWIRARLGWQHQFPRSRQLENFRQRLMSLALSPATQEAEAQASDNHTYSLFGEEA